jgi:membrane fusion protein, multidrug efflux system
MSNRRKPGTTSEIKTPDATAETQPDAAPAPASQRMRKVVGVSLIAIIGPVAAVLAGLYIYMVGGRFISTDNAYVKADKIAISTDISGRVEQVLVRENERVKAGDILFRLDTEPPKIALRQAEARLNASVHEIDALHAQLAQKRASLKLAQGDTAFFERQFRRQENLSNKGFTSEITLDTASKNLRNARDQISMLEQDLAEVLARLGGDADMPSEQHPTVLAAKAARDQAALDLRRTEVRAPVDGIVTNFDLQRGEHIEAGDVVFSLVGTDELWVAANFKETDLTHVRVGQPATIRVDTYPEVVHQAVVSSISPATGAEFALLPPQNATGNWVKVVQRLTVRLTLTNPSPEAPLRAGMSSVVEIDTGHKRELPGLVSDAIGWARNLI